TTGGGNYFSVGLAFDVIDGRSWQAVYTSVKGQTVQTFHRENGAEVYPPAGIVPCPVKLNEEVTLDFAARCGLVNVWVNGQLKIVYWMPLARRDGTFALWTLDAAAEFLEVRLEALPPSAALAGTVKEARRSPLDGPITVTKTDLEQAVRQAEAG